MRWKLTTLIENHVDKEERYMCEHGLAILIESENQEEQVCLLMDTGQSGIFYENAAKMGISLENLSALLISHAHYDHAGGVKRLIEEETIRKIYVGKDLHVIGPAPASVGKVKDVYRRVLYLKHENYDLLVRIKDRLEEYIEINSGFRKVNIQFDFS